MKLLKNIVCLIMTMISLFFHELVYLINKNFENEVYREDDEIPYKEIEEIEENEEICLNKTCNNCDYYLDGYCRYSSKRYKCRLEELEDLLGVNGQVISNENLTEIYKEYLKIRYNK